MESVEPDYPGAKRESVYYKYYTYFFRDEQAVVETDRTYLTLSEALHIDDCIREYNRIIRELFREKNQQYQAIFGKDRYHIRPLTKVDNSSISSVFICVYLWSKKPWEFLAQYLFGKIAEGDVALKSNRHHERGTINRPAIVALCQPRLDLGPVLTSDRA